MNFDSDVGCNSLFFPRDPLVIFWFTYKLISIKEAHNSQHSLKHPINVLSIIVIFRFSLLLCLLLWITLAYASFPLWALALFSCPSNTYSSIYTCAKCQLCATKVFLRLHTHPMLYELIITMQWSLHKHTNSLYKNTFTSRYASYAKIWGNSSNACDLQLPREYIKTSPFISMQKAAAEGQVFTSNLQPLICFVCLDQG